LTDLQDSDLQDSDAEFIAESSDGSGGSTDDEAAGLQADELIDSDGVECSQDEALESDWEGDDCEQAGGAAVAGEARAGRGRAASRRTRRSVVPPGAALAAGRISRQAADPRTGRPARQLRWVGTLCMIGHGMLHRQVAVQGSTLLRWQWR
jgi:hypothetical protein